ncbi:MAG: Gfo/Idh/MocA family oxidoreductase [Gemmatimonadaceae bacterium]|nr:Gfo/Idh/MocA family oxidoreductase [Gemmatimonadaceae bacterium]
MALQRRAALAAAVVVEAPQVGLTLSENSVPAEPFRVGLIGYGLAGAVFHGPLIEATNGLHLAAIVTRDPGRQDEARRAHPGAILFDTTAQVWGHAHNLDLIVVASPNRTHVPLALEAIAAGLHVVVDKPLAPTASEARRVIDEARERGRMLTVFQNRRWDGDFLTVSRLLDEDALGTPLRFESRFERWRPVPKPGWREHGASEEAGGLLYDLGSHLIDQALVLFGPASHVYAELDRRRPSVEVDDDAFVALIHASGVRSHLFMSAVAAQPGPRFRLLGSRAAYVKYGLDVQEAALRSNPRLDATGFGEDPRDAWGLLGSGDEARPIPTEVGGYQRFYEAVGKALRTSGPPPVDPAGAVAVLEIIEAAQRSAADRRVIALKGTST